MLGLHRPVPDHHQNLAQRGLPPQPVAYLQITNPRIGARDSSLHIVVTHVISHMLEGKMRRLPMRGCDDDRVGPSDIAAKTA